MPMAGFKYESWPAARAQLAPARACNPAVVLVAQANDGSRVTRPPGVGGYLHANHSTVELTSTLEVIKYGAAPPSAVAAHPLSELASLMGGGGSTVDAAGNAAAENTARHSKARKSTTSTTPLPAPPLYSKTATATATVLTGLLAGEAAALSDRLVCSDVFEVLAVGGTLESVLEALECSSEGGWVQKALKSLHSVQQLHHRWHPQNLGKQAGAGGAAGVGGGNVPGAQLRFTPGIGKKRIKAFHRAVAAKFELTLHRELLHRCNTAAPGNSRHAGRAGAAEGAGGAAKPSTAAAATQLCLFSYPAAHNSSGEEYVLAVEFGGTYKVREYCERFASLSTSVPKTNQSPTMTQSPTMDQGPTMTQSTAELNMTPTRPSLSLVMTNLARVSKASVVIDPFSGRGGMIAGARHVGAFVLGADLLPQEPRGDVTTGGRGAWCDVVVSDVFRSIWRTGGRENPTSTRAVATDTDSGCFISDYTGEELLERVSEMMAPVLELSVDVLVPGGRLVYLLPVFPAQDHLGVEQTTCSTASSLKSKISVAEQPGCV
eukprot:gene14238-14202_t